MSARDFKDKMWFPEVGDLFFFPVPDRFVLALRPSEQQDGGLDPMRWDMLMVDSKGWIFVGSISTGVMYWTVQLVAARRST